MICEDAMDAPAAEDLRWHVIYAAMGNGGYAPLRDGEDPKDYANRKTMVELALQRKGFVTYHPMYRVEKRVKIRDKTKDGVQSKMVTLTLWRSLFPRYMFVGAPKGLSAWDIKETEFVNDILYDRSTRCPAEIPAWKVDLLRSEVSKGLFDQLLFKPVQAKELAQPRSVRILGVLPGKSVVDETVEEGGRANVEFNLFGREWLVKVPLDKMQLAC